MRVWPVLLVWDSALERRHYEKVEKCLFEKARTFETLYSLVPDVEIIRFSLGAEVTTSKLNSEESSVLLESRHVDRSPLNVHSREYKEFETALLRQRFRLSAKSAVAPTIIRFSIRQISQPNEYAILLDKIRQNVGDLSVFEYQARKKPSQNKPWLSENLMFNHHLQDVIKENVSPQNEDQIEKFFKQISWHLEDGFSRQGLFGLGLATDVVAGGISGSGQPIAAPPVTVGVNRDPVPLPAAPSRPWKKNNDSSMGNEELQRPAREYSPVQKVVPNEIDATISSLATVSDDVKAAVEELLVPPTTQFVENIESNELLVTTDAEQTERVLVAEQKISQPGENEATADMSTGRRRNPLRRWKSGGKRGRPDAYSHDVETEPMIQISTDRTDAPAETLAEPETLTEAEPLNEVCAEKENVLQVATNGNLILDKPSIVNAREWWVKNKNSDPWFKIPNVGPSRDVEFEYGGVDSLRLLASSVRGTRHQFYGEPNQDAFAIGKNEKFLIVVVCDGVGSAKYSAYGSKFISYSVSRSLVRSLEEVKLGDRDAIRVAMTQAVQKASDQVQTWNDGALFAPDETASEVDRQDLSATLVVAVIEIQPSGDDGRLVVMANVGDSPCYTLTDSTWELRTAVTKDGEIMDQATSALPSEVGLPVELEFHEFVMGRRAQLVLMTDGIGTALASGRTPLGLWLGERLSKPQLAADFLATVSFDRLAEDDDRTLVVLYDIDHVFTPPPQAALISEVNAELTDTVEAVEEATSPVPEGEGSLLVDGRGDDSPEEMRQVDVNSVD